MITPTDDDLVLQFDPWGERDATFVTLDDRMTVVRKAHRCAICFDDIAVGARVRAKREADDGTCRTFYFCAVCCQAMVRRGRARTEEDEMEIENRYEVGRQRAEGNR